MEYIYFIVGGLTLVAYVMHFVWMSRISRAATRIAAILEDEKSMRSGVQWDLNHIKKHYDAAKAAAPAPPTGAAADDDYDASLIPLDRWYQYSGNVGGRLVEAGLITNKELNRAREEFAKRGGHLCDHVLAMGFTTKGELDKALGRPS